MSKRILNGNFKDVITERDGNHWVMGHFMPPDSPLQTNDLEIKWGKHKKGEAKKSSGTNKRAKTLAILIEGKVLLTFDDEKVILKEKGDYVYWDSGVIHSWEVLKDSLIITIRWPSIPGDQKSA